MKNFFRNKKLLILLIFLLLSFYFIFSTINSFVRDGYDRQSKLVIMLKSIISPHYVKKIKDNIFVIPNLKSRNEFLELQVKKYEQGLKGEKFKNNLVKIGNENYELNYFFIPFKRLDTNLGWNAITNSLRAHYLEIYNDKVFLISGEGQTIYFDKNNLNKDSLNFTKIKNNISEIISQNNLELIGIRDLYIYNDKIFISMITKNQSGITMDIYQASINYNELEFDIFFRTEEYWENYNVFSGGRIEKLSEESILFSIGYSGVHKASQSLDSLLGKIIKINLKNKNYEIISYGHRNPQGLRYLEKYDIIINSEHGPKGGDEINVNKLKENKKNLKNFGWDIASYGIAYDGTDPFKKSHKDYGFVEPLKYYTPSIGISEILYLEENNFCKNKCIWTSSLRANSIYILSVDDEFNKIISSERLFLKKNRIRDIDYDADLNSIIFLSENIPSIIFLRKK